jgi:hypothetical protein
MTPKNFFLSKMQYGLKNKKRRIWFRFLIHWRSWKKSHPKKVINEKVTEKLSFFFTFLYSTVCESFSGDFFALFSTDTNSASNVAFYDTQMEVLRKKFILLILALIANFKAIIGGNGSKNEKHIFKMCLRIPFHIYLRSGTWKLHFFQKKSKSLYPIYTVIQYIMHLHGPDMRTRYNAFSCFLRPFYVTMIKKYVKENRQRVFYRCFFFHESAPHLTLLKNDAFKWTVRSDKIGLGVVPMLWKTKYMYT